MHGEVQHDPFGHEGVTVITLSGEDRKPDPHPMSTAVEPQRGCQMRFFWIGLFGEPDRLTTRCQDSGQRLK